MVCYNTSYCLNLQKNTSSQAVDDNDDRPQYVPQTTKVSIFETAIKLVNTPKPKTDQNDPATGGNFAMSISVRYVTLCVLVLLCEVN